MGGKQVLDLRLLLPAGAVLGAGWGFSLLTIGQFMVLLWLILLIIISLLLVIAVKIRHPGHLKAGISQLLIVVLLVIVVFALQIMIFLQLKINTADPLSKYMAAGELRIQVQGYVDSSAQAYVPVGLAHNSENAAFKQQGQKANCRRGKITLRITKFHTFINSSQWLVSSQRLQLQNLCIEGLHKGQLVELLVQLYRPKNNPSNTAAEVIPVRQLQVAELQSELKAVALGKAKILAEPAGIEAVNQKMGQRLVAASGGEISRQLLPAVILGDRGELKGELLAAFKAAGLLHIICLSGMHLNIIVAILRVATAGLARKIQFILQVGVVLGFYWLVGGGPSVLRAALMAIIVFNAGIFGGGQSLHSLFLVVIAIVIIAPNTAYNLGFLYSVLATFGILLGSHKITQISSLCAEKISNVGSYLGGKERQHRGVVSSGRLAKLAPIMGKAAEIMGISLLANLFTLPLSIFYQGGINPLFPLANLLVLPLLPVLILAGLGILLLTMLPTCFEPLTAVLASIIELICGFIWQVAHNLG